jgi:hypothetical protein
MKTPTLCIALACLILGSENAHSAAAVLYTIRDADDHLIAIDTDTLQRTDVGPLGVQFEFGGLGYDPAGDVLYMIGGDVNPALYTINRATGAATLVGNTGVNRLFGLDYDTRNGVLYASQYAPLSAGLFALNKTTGAATLVGNFSGTGFGALAYDPNSDRLLGLKADLGELYAINPTNAATNLLADGPSFDDGGLAFDLQHGLIWAIDMTGSLYSYDPAAGYARTTRLSGLGGHDGLAFVIPEPTSAAMGLCASALAFSGRRHRRRTVCL